LVKLRSRDNKDNLTNPIGLIMMFEVSNLEKIKKFTDLATVLLQLKDLRIDQEEKPCMGFI